MQVLADVWVLVIVAFVLVAPLTLFLPFYIAAKARGIERALRDIATELQVTRVSNGNSGFGV